ncbi:MAG: AmmeMemoRadiSam system protein A [Anaerolineae bacterium]|nr:AmmeMemoRadiSam system protein A [Anaerolineae bacterium]MDH7472624.1 AmmeMemoRadiSam system protein A [Anaerolineae bacterium]
MSESHPLVQLARKTIETYVREGRVIKQPEELTPEMQQQAGTFVSLHSPDGELRGCIGTIEPTQDNVALEVIQNAISAATRDPRFPPVRPEELDGLDVKVDVLMPPEPVESLDQLDPKRYGVIVESATDWRRGLLLPDLEGVDTVEYQVDIARRKAFIGPHEPVKLYRFEVKRYT